MSFSERKGLKPKKDVIQIKSMDDDLRNGLWSNLTIHYWNNLDSDDYDRVYISTDSNNILKRELSAYRFVNGIISQITSEEEIASIEEALDTESEFENVSIHLKQALVFLSDRKSPSFRKSMDESILAVEAICQKITGDKKTTLGKALKTIEHNKKIELHPALIKAFNSLYGYTNDAEGIRHAVSDKPTLDFEDAKFMLVICSAFINYLKPKIPK